MKNKLDYPGSIISRTKQSGNTYWYYKSALHNTWQASKLTATKSNWQIVAEMVKRDFLISEGLLKDKEINQEITIYKAYEEYKTWCNRNNRSKNTMLAIDLSFRSIIKKDFQLEKMEIINHRKKVYHVELLVEEFVDNNIGILSNATINLRIRSFNPFLVWCYKEKSYFQYEVGVRKYMLPAKEKDIEPFSNDEVTAILKLAYKSDVEFCYWLALMRLNGLRPGESLSLEWKNIDFKNKIIKLENKITKTLIQELPISELTEKILLRLKAISSKRPVKYKRQFVFRLTPVTRKRWNEKFNQICKDVGCYIHGSTFHRFRKTFITQIDNMNLTFTEFKTLARLKDYKTAEKHYIKKDREKLRVIMNDLNNIK